MSKQHDIVHPNDSNYPNQRIFVICIREYVYLVPYVERDDEIFLKTIIPSRKFTKLYLGEFRVGVTSLKKTQQTVSTSNATI